MITALLHRPITRPKCLPPFWSMDRTAVPYLDCCCSDHTTARAYIDLQQYYKRGSTHHYCVICHHNLRHNIGLRGTSTNDWDDRCRNDVSPTMLKYRLCLIIATCKIAIANTCHVDTLQYWLSLSLELVQACEERSLVLLGRLRGISLHSRIFPFIQSFHPI